MFSYFSNSSSSESYSVYTNTIQKFGKSEKSELEIQKSKKIKTWIVFLFSYLIKKDMLANVSHNTRTEPKSQVTLMQIRR